MSELKAEARATKSAKQPGGTAPKRARQQPANVTEIRLPRDRRDQILKIASRRFAEFGYEATTIRQIADDANILSGSIYHHFDTKDDILDEIIRTPSFLMGSRSCGVATCGADPETKLVALILLQLEGLTTNSEAYGVLWNERRFLRKHAHFDYVLKNKADIHNSWTDVLRDGVELGYFRPKIDPFLTISTTIRI